MPRKPFSHAFLTFYHVSLNFARFLGSLLQSRCTLAAENLFLRKQLASIRNVKFDLEGPRMPVYPKNFVAIDF
jgi:hypothetical protein